MATAVCSWGLDVSGTYQNLELVFLIPHGVAFKFTSLFFVFYPCYVRCFWNKTLKIFHRLSSLVFVLMLCVVCIHYKLRPIFCKDLGGLGDLCKWMKVCSTVFAHLNSVTVVYRFPRATVKGRNVVWSVEFQRVSLNSSHHVTSMWARTRRQGEGTRNYTCTLPECWGRMLMC